jgi:opacity protein-like surface antigen
MKTIGFSLLSALLLLEISPAQVQLGIAGGLNYSQAQQSNFFFSEAHSTTGWTISGILDYAITQNVSLRIEPTYVENGTYAQPVSYKGIVPKLSFDLSYLELPLMLKYSVGKDLRPYLVFGPSLGFNLSSNVGAEISGPWFGQLEVMAGAGNIVRSLECSLQFGGGLSYQVDDILTMFLEAKYAHALSNTLKQGGVLVSGMDETVSAGVLKNATYKNKGFIIMFGFTLPL